MDAYLSKACWRAGAKLVAGFAVIGALVGIRIVTATPTGLDADLEELERLDAELAAGGASSRDGQGASMADGEPGNAVPRAMGAAAGTGSEPGPGGAGADLDRMVRCEVAGRTQFMRAA
ncbi:MAG: hypothetical protein K2X91_14385, partial [Thermoleophilia bacterium]|nr:hypothetical protein [Thermoleophilia bacterium]